MLDREQLREFAKRGYLVIPGVVPASMVERTNREIDELIRQQPPPENHRGFHF